MITLKADDKQNIKERFSRLPFPVKLKFFTQENDCDSCLETRQILRELEELSSMIDVEVFDAMNDGVEVKEYNIDKFPAIAMVGDSDYGIRFFGSPSGFELISLIHAIEMVGKRSHGLGADTLKKISTISTPLHLQVFVTPTCPNCPSAVVLAHQLALANKHIRADMVEITEFPHLMIKHEIRSVPRIVINEITHFEGALPEEMVLSHILEAAKSSSS